MACSLFWPFLHCYYASWITEEIDDTGATAYATHWFDLPIKMQRYVILMMIRTNESLNFTGLDIINCDMETLGKVEEFVDTSVSQYQFHLQFAIFYLFIALEFIIFVLYDLSRII